MPNRTRFAVVIPGIFSVKTKSHGPILKAGGDVRAAEILRLRGPTDPTPVVFTSHAAVEAFRTYVPEGIEAVSVDNSFDDVSGNVLAISLFLILRTLSTLLALNSSRTGRSVTGLYSTSNALPDVLVCAITKLVRRSLGWIAVVHHVPEDVPESYGSSLQRVISLASFTLALWLVAKGADKVVAYHAPTIKRLRSLGVSTNRLVFNSNGVDLSEIQARREVAPGRRGDQVVCVSRLSQVKGIPIVLQMWSEVARSRPRARLILIGAEDAMDQDDVRAIVTRLGISDSVSLRGVIPRDELLDELLSCRLAVAPSFVEGWGLSVLECLACGTPVVAWDLEAYHPFQSGLVSVPVSDQSRFVAAVQKLLDDDLEWINSSRAASKASSPYSWKSVAAREWEVLGGLFGTSARIAKKDSTSL